MQTLLVLFGWFAVIASALIILVPYLRRRRDLINSWSLFHVGCINFIGIASIQSGSALGHQYTTPTDADYAKFVLGGLLFYLVSTLTYHYFHWVQRISGRFFTKWGPRQPKVLGLLVPLALLGILGAAYTPNIQFIGQMSALVGQYAAIFAVAFCMTLWLNRPFNVFLIVVSIAALMVVGLAVSGGFGRQGVLSLAITFPLCWYWVRARYYNAAQVLSVLAVCTVVAGVVLSGITLVRGIKMNPDLGFFEVAWEKIKAIPEAMRLDTPGDSIFGGDAVEASLATIRLYDRTQPIEPFHTIIYVIANPMPRAWWPQKPLALGYTLPIDIGWSSAHGGVNLGPGIIGHGYHEGGLFFIAFYAFLYAAIMRFFDSLLVRDPGNPYLLGMLGSFSAQVVAFSRGDIGLYTALILGATFSTLLLTWLIRIFFGTERQTFGAAPESGFDPNQPAQNVDYFMPDGYPSHTAQWEHQ